MKLLKSFPKVEIIIQSDLSPRTVVDNIMESFGDYFSFKNIIPSLGNKKHSAFIMGDKILVVASRYRLGFRAHYSIQIVPNGSGSTICGSWVVRSFDSGVFLNLATCLLSIALSVAIISINKFLGILFVIVFSAIVVIYNKRLFTDTTAEEIDELKAILNKAAGNEGHVNIVVKD